MSIYSLEQEVSRAVSKRYSNAEKTKFDVSTVLRNYRGLTPHLKNFVFRSGASRFLLCLEGTIPVTFKGSTYNIPICIWLLDNHPLCPPMVFVKPTPNMQIKSSLHVDQNGKVFLPYLHEWNPNSSDLVGLIQIMIIVFSDMPPVYSKPRTNPSVTPYPTPYPTNPPGYMPMPGVGGNLPYPTSQPTPPSSTPYPPYPSQAGYPPTSTPYPVYPPNPSSTPSSYPPHPYSSGVPPYSPYPPTTSNPSTKTSSSEAVAAPNTGTITEEHIRASLVSAVSDRARARLRDTYGGAQAEVSVLRQQQADLTQGKARLEALIAKLEQEQSELDKNVRVLREREAEMKALVTRLESDTQPLDVDEAVTTTAPLYKQLLNCYAEDQATQDAIYYLCEALRQEVVDLDTCLRHVRSLSRKQFQLRATMSKCRLKGNMAG